ncbi:MAG: N-acetylmuramoyl-L-alanine amidase [Pseudomonadota bacterium]
MVILHYTAMATAKAALARLCDPMAEVSAHYLIAEDGQIWALVAEDRRAWHAGVAGWGAVRDVNSHSIGIELANPGTHPFAEPQMQALEDLLGAILARWQIAPERVVGHACIAPGRKIDPGPRFDWRRLARAGLAVWLDPEEAHTTASFHDSARRFGYPLEGDGWDESAQAVWQSFTERFLPAHTPPPGAPWAVAHLARLAARWPVALDRARTTP